MAAGTDISERARLLGELRPFARISPEERLRFVREASHRRYGTGEVLREDGAPVDDAVFVLSGQVKVVIQRLDDQRLILGIFGPEHPAGGLGLFSETFPGRIEALSDVQTAELPPAALRNLLDRTGDGLDPFQELANQRARYLVERLEAATVRPAERRLALVFQMLRDHWGERPDTEADADGGIRVPLSIRRRDLADLINTRTETAIRLVRDWERSGLLRTDAEGFVIADPDEIDALAVGDG